ncbi:hypothetical protein P3T18_003973 [Paraburkholderia sp. GAS199]|uniref:hypothetical protein n=1 Tax=Paraburkholderia sp. GAS199 TaxID=3035126 RepID=UPI003D25E372
MHNAPATADRPAPSLLRDVRYTIVPHQLRGVSAGLAALDLEANPGALVMPDRGENAVRHEELVAYTRPVICVAAMHCRSLLQFLGVDCGDGAAMDVATDATSEAAPDIWIGTFDGRNGRRLEPVPLSVLERFGDSQRVQHAWTATARFAAQALVDAMNDPALIDGTLAPMLRRTFETVPDVVNRWFYERAVLVANR